MKDPKRGVSLVFHSGTENRQQEVVTSGGRVLVVTSYGKTMEEALHTSYRNIERINFDKAYYRKDIGFDLHIR